MYNTERLPENVVPLKAPPHSVEAEQAVLGALMLDNTQWHVVRDLISSADFYRREHREIFAAMELQTDESQPIDVLTLSDTLSDAGKLREAGGIDYLGALATNTQSAANVEAYAKIVQERAILRKLIAVAHSVADSGYNTAGRSGVELVASAQSALLAVMDGKQEGQSVHINDAMRKAVWMIEQRAARGGRIAGLSSGFKDIDRLTGGFKPGEMILVAGRPSMGKSTLAQNFIEHAALAGKHVLFFSVEMPVDMVAMRHVSSVGKVPLNALVNAQINELGEGIVNAGAKLRDRFYEIDDSPGLTSAQILLRAQRVQMRTGKPLDLIVVDYMQKLRDVGENQNNRLQEISGNIKHAARVLNCPVIALSQLSRECEKRSDKRPMLSDLRDSGSLEQDADIVMFIYRDVVYNRTSEMAGVAEILVRKNRNGETGDCFLTSRLDVARFENFTGLIPTKEGKRYALD